MCRLPDRWCLAPIRDLIDFAPKNDCSDDTDVGFVPLARLGVSYCSGHTSETRKWAEVKRGYSHFADGDVLLARITPSFENGKAGVARELPNGLGAGSTEYLVCRPLEGGLLSEYLLAYFKSQRFLRAGARIMSGAVGQKRVPRKYVLDSTIPLAPVNEQRRIVAKLNSIVGRVDECRTHLDRVRTVLNRFRQAVLAAATSGDLTKGWRETATVTATGRDLLHAIRENHAAFAERSQQPFYGTTRHHGRRRRYRVPEPVDRSGLDNLPGTWAWASSAELVKAGDEIVYGILQPGQKLNDGTPYIRGSDIKDGRILVEQLLRTSPEVAARHARSSLRGGDVLLGIIRATKVAIVPDALTGANITQGTARFRPSQAIRTAYLAIALEAPATQAWLHERYRGIDMPGLNLADIRRVPISLPPTEEQDEIICRVTNLLTAARRALEVSSRMQNLLDHLTASIFERTFCGALVAQDPRDESAAELLARIRVTRTKRLVTRGRRRPPRSVKMPSTTPDSLKSVIRALQSDRFTFEQLRLRTDGDYESLRDSLFLLLGEDTPVVRQVFDVKTARIVLERKVKQ